MGPVNTRVTTMQPVVPQAPAAKPVAGGITNIPQERIQEYTTLFGRI